MKPLLYTIPTLFIALLSLSCNMDNNANAVFQKDINNQHYQAVIKIESIGSGVNNTGVIQKSRGGVSEGDEKYRINGDLEYIAGRLSNHQIDKANQEHLKHTIDININFKSPDKKKEHLKPAREHLFEMVLNQFECDTTKTENLDLWIISVSNNTAFNDR